MSDEHKRLCEMTLQERDAWTEAEQKKLIEEDMKRDKKWKLGLIEESGYLCLGDTYTEPGKAFNDSSRTKGLNMKVPGIKLGSSEDPNKYFSTGKPVCIGDPFMSAQDRKLVERQKSRDIDRKNRIDTVVANGKRKGMEMDPSSVDLEDLKPWNPCGPQMKYDDLYLSEFDKTTNDSKIMARLKEDKEKRLQKKNKGDDEVGPKNITCNPLPRGGPGVAGTFPVAEWIPEPYREDEEKARMERMKQRKERSDDKKPFRPVSIMKTNIVDAVEIPKWIPNGDKSDKTQAEICKEARIAARTADVKKPFRPSNPMKKGYPQGYPSLPCPDTNDGPRRKKVDDDVKGWKPSSSKSTRPTRSVATSRRNLGVFKANFFKKF